MDVFTCSPIIDWLGCYGKGSESDVRHSVWLSFHIHESIISWIGSEFDFEAFHSNRITVTTNMAGCPPPHMGHWFIWVNISVCFPLFLFSRVRSWRIRKWKWTTQHTTDTFFHGFEKISYEWCKWSEIGCWHHATNIKVFGFWWMKNSIKP